ncbi:glutathione S-transferase family protein [Oleisolibacter albus]|uniref:glutathione S-transferase family protein n=1 Tax=Oleisolibacter albus TaxID=2171757 RepID=UPI000DF2D6EB|nr:glutathione S-transferase N-terminal domain-containing protein [Oleisolibacter albus]
MKLYVNATSPYARKLLVLLREKGAADRVDLVSIDPWSAPDELVAHNPVSKVPTLVTGAGWALTESWAIADYLDAVLPGPRLLPAEGEGRWRDLRLAALAQGLLDAAFAAAAEGRRPEDGRSPAWVARQRAVAMRTLPALTAALPDLSAGFGLGALSVAVALDYLAFRHGDLAWERQAPDLAGWFRQAAARPSLRATDPR